MKVLHPINNITLYNVGERKMSQYCHRDILDDVQSKVASKSGLRVIALKIVIRAWIIAIVK